MIVYCYQFLLVSRFQIVRPDTVLPWTSQYTENNVANDSIYYTSSFVDFYADPRVAWDAGYYLSIATAGYDDPNMAVVQLPDGEAVSLNYAFLPLYPLLTRLVIQVGQLLGLTSPLLPIYAGVFVSLLGSFVAAIALYNLVEEQSEQGDGVRAAFYLFVFPTSFFLAQVYTEGLFVGLAFSCLAFVRRQQWMLAAVLATLATLTRIVGIGLVIPLAVAMLTALRKEWLAEKHVSWSATRRLLLLLIPFLTFFLWRASWLGKGFDSVETYHFGRRSFAIIQSWKTWWDVVSSLAQGSQIRRVYYGIEFAGIALALAACIGTFRRHLPLTLFGLFVLLTSVTSNIPQSMIRYVVVVPSIYIWLSQLGRYEIFDRLWTLISVLLLGLLLMLFTFDMWVG